MIILFIYLLSLFYLFAFADDCPILETLVNCTNVAAGCQYLIFNDSFELREDLDLGFLNSTVYIEAPEVRVCILLHDVSFNSFLFLFFSVS